MSTWFVPADVSMNATAPKAVTPIVSKPLPLSLSIYVDVRMELVFRHASRTREGPEALAVTSPGGNNEYLNQVTTKRELSCSPAYE